MIDTHGNIRLIVLDHDPYTLMSIDTQILNIYPHGCDVCAGTFPPFYLLDDYLAKRLGWINRLDKLPSVGIAMHCPLSLLSK